jgi:hypothetical protein
MSKRKLCSFYIEPEMLEALASRAEFEGTDRSDLIRRYIRDGLDRPARGLEGYARPEPAETCPGCHGPVAEAQSHVDFADMSWTCASSGLEMCGLTLAPDGEGSRWYCDRVIGHLPPCRPQLRIDLGEQLFECVLCQKHFRIHELLRIGRGKICLACDDREADEVNEFMMGL